MIPSGSFRQLDDAALIPVTQWHVHRIYHSEFSPPHGIVRVGRHAIKRVSFAGSSGLLDRTRNVSSGHSRR